jgi:DNA replication protein DnaC
VVNTVAICVDCGGSGWKIIERDGISAAEKCDCQLIGRADRVESAAAIPLLYQNASLENFLLPSDNPNARTDLGSVLLKVKSFVREFPPAEKPGLLFVGDPGTGKTHLAVAALRALIARGFEGVFFDYQNLLDRIRSGYDKTSEIIDKDAYRSALDTQILLLDDLGAHRVTDWVEDTVTSLITYRCNNRKAFIATTNAPDPDAGSSIFVKAEGMPSGHAQLKTLAERIGMRARSRLFEMCRVIKMPLVEDYRVRTKAR